MHDHQPPVERIREMGQAPEGFEFHLQAFCYGMPPRAGWGLGLSRRVMAMLNLENIRDAVIFPRDKKAPRALDKEGRRSSYSFLTPAAMALISSPIAPRPCHDGYKSLPRK